MPVAFETRYLLMAVWLSMHASICSHSFGVRLLTRFVAWLTNLHDCFSLCTSEWFLTCPDAQVRLPVPGMSQMGVLNARLADFEKQGPLKNLNHMCMSSALMYQHHF